MVAIAIYIRLQLQETPIFQAIKAKGQTAISPWREAFMGENLKYVAIATIVVLGEGVVWYSGQFWALYFIQQQTPDILAPNVITGAALLIAAPSLILFGWLSDRIGPGRSASGSHRTSEHQPGADAAPSLGAAGGYARPR